MRRPSSQKKAPPAPSPASPAPRADPYTTSHLLRRVVIRVVLITAFMYFYKWWVSRNGGKQQQIF